MNTTMARPRIAAGTYVPITKDDLEGWLDTIGYRGKWNVHPGTAGVYIIHLSDQVGIKLGSTIGSREDAMGRGLASMQLALVSRVTGRVLNKKAQGQSHFKRTLGWKTNWQGGLEVMRKTYLGAQDFYDTIAVIADQEKYKRDLIERIEKIPNWSNLNQVVRLHSKVSTGGVLLPRDRDILADAERAAEDAAKKPAAPPPGPVKTTGPKIDAVRNLFRAVRDANDVWTMEFAKSIGTSLNAGRSLSAPQIKILKEKLDRYGIKSDTASASALF